MSRYAYLDGLRVVPELRGLPRRDLIEIGRLAETVDLPAGESAPRGESVIVPCAPNRYLVIEGRAWPRVLELAPDLANRGLPVSRVDTA